MRELTESERLIIEEEPHAVCGCKHHLMLHDYEDGSGTLYCTACTCEDYDGPVDDQQ